MSAPTALATLVLDQTYDMGGHRAQIHAPTTIVLRLEDGMWRVALVHSVPMTEAI
jgi:ketosteroid isomerase-like protein